MTREAVALYLSRLSSDGLLAFHISNRHLDLRPILAALAAEHGLTALVQTHLVDGRDTTRNSSEWVVMGRSPAAVASLVNDRRWKPLQAVAGKALWTDDYSDILSVLVH
jgi:hypothetical protein